jgi:TonB family protein
VARAGQGVAGPASLRRLGFALAASFAAHGALLGALPRDWDAGAFSLSAPARERLQVRFSPEPPAVLLARPVPAPPALPLAPRYFGADELDTRPQILSHVEPQFPVLALAPEGRVVLRLYVDEQGRVERIATETDDPGGAFAAAAREAFGGARFLPGVRNGVAVKALLRVEVRFGSPHPDNASR